MEYLPVEVIGNILSRLGAARDVVIASSTCRKWREAWKNHLHTLTFNSNDWPVYHDLTRSRLEIIITQTIFQTNGLQSLSIIMDDVDEFSAAPLIAWLMYTRETLRQLHYNVSTTPNINVLEKCGRQRFESSPHSLPRVAVLNLVSIDIVMSDPQATMELTSNSLKDIYVEAICLDKIILEADSLEKLHLKDCTLDVFELVSKGKLKLLKIDDVSVIHLDIGESAENLEIVDVSNFTIMWSKFHHMIAKSSKLRRLRLWGVVFYDDDEAVDIETISACFPQLSHLSLSYELREIALHYGSEDSFKLENVVVLELGWAVISDLFSHWVAGLLERCPNLRKLILNYCSLQGVLIALEKI
ncbi:hypothetical protein K7X08_014197 [Anisodus acutangulus]|uniref:F-box domain-containing protein n=1 Tax=Anisodus acutangulus TaxID=402998 RepID=A0A9Q1R2W2_9SOLA|nr:hypothetical protein K7X08_014197 [Anisodus acutangulus]